VLLAVTACESLDLSGSFDQPGSLNVSSFVVFFNLTALKRCMHKLMSFQALVMESGDRTLCGGPTVSPAVLTGS
jgi:hypothetical protein